MNTLATRKQSEAIRDRMRSIRCDLPYAMDEAREDFQQIFDWKYYVRQLPLLSVTAAFALGYLIVPDASKQDHPESESSNWLHRFQPTREQEEDEPHQASFFGGLLGAAAALAVRTGVSIALRQVGRSILGPTSPSNESTHFINQ
jgi:hypothetical protein